MKTPMDFRNEVFGKAIDVDGAYGAQCWDGYAYYMKWLGYPYANCTTTGYAKDLWNDRASNGIRNSCDEVSVMQQGDIAVFKEDRWTPFSHVAIFMKDLGGGYGLFLGENQGGANGAFNEIRLPYQSTFDTAFRPKCYQTLFAPDSTTNETQAPSSKAPDQILHKGSVVEFARLLRVENFNPSNGLIYNGRIGGWLNPAICYEDSASDGAQDQFFANTNATFTIQGRFHVGDVQLRHGVWDAYINELHFWVHCEPLIEVVDA